MTTDQAITEALAEDAAGRESKIVARVAGDGMQRYLQWHKDKPAFGYEIGAAVVLESDYDELRQQLADVTNERDALRAAQQWVLVPLEPTEDMIGAVEGDEYTFATGDEEWTGLVSEDMACELYKAMIAAAPAVQPPAVGGDPIKLSDDVREYLQEGIENATGGEDEDIDHDFAEELCLLLGPLYRHAQPATAKVVLPERMEIPSEHAGAYAFRSGWNACLLEVATLNGVAQ